MGKGSARRKEDKQKINDNWDLIWGKKDKEVKDIKEERSEEKLKTPVKEDNSNQDIV